jgi:hypothetical protein
MKQQVDLLMSVTKGQLGLTRSGARMCLSNDTLYVLSYLEEISPTMFMFMLKDPCK